MCLGKINNNYGAGAGPRAGAKATAQAFPVQNGGVGVTGQIQSSDQSVTVTGTGVVNQSGKPLGGGIGVQTYNDGVGVGGNINFDGHGQSTGGNIGVSSNNGDGVTTHGNMNFDGYGHANGGNIGVSSNNGDGMTTYGNMNFDNNGHANGGSVGFEYRF